MSGHSQHGHTGVLPPLEARRVRVLLTAGGAGRFIAGFGALNDVTITQASAVWELHASDPAAPRRTVAAGAVEPVRSMSWAIAT